MGVSHNESFAYNDWRITRSGNNVSSSGTASKFSSLYPLNKVIGSITGTVHGGFGWCSAYDEDYEERGDSLYCNLTATIYLVTAAGERTAIASATGSASRSGYLQCYASQTSASLNFNTANITDAQKAAYEYIQIGYTCSTSKSTAHVHQEGAFNNGGTANPSGSVTLTIRDTINVNYDGTDMTNLYFDSNEMSGLYYDGTKIF